MKQYIIALALITAVGTNHLSAMERGPRVSPMHIVDQVQKQLLDYIMQGDPADPLIVRDKNLFREYCHRLEQHRIPPTIVATAEGPQLHISKEHMQILATDEAMAQSGEDLQSLKRSIVNLATCKPNDIAFQLSPLLDEYTRRICLTAIDSVKS